MRNKKVFPIFAFALLALIFANIAYADLYLNSRAGSIYFNTTNTARMQVTSGGNLILLGNANVSIPGNLSVGGNFSVDTNTLFVDSTNNYVGIGTTTPSENLVVIGSVSAFGSLNATYINATEIRQGTNMVQTVNAVFNLGNLTQYLGGSDVNASLVKAGNLSALDTLSKYIKVGDFDTRNISNYTQYAKAIVNNSPANLTDLRVHTINGTDLALFNKSVMLGDYALTSSLGIYLTKVSNITNGTDLNLTNLNVFSLNGSALSLFNKSVMLGDYALTSSLAIYLTKVSNITNGTDLNLTNLNVFSLNGSALSLFNKSIDLSSYAKSSDLAIYQAEVNAWKIINLTDFFGDASFNSSVLRVSNMSNIREGAFNKGNLSLAPFSNYTKENLSTDLSSGVVGTIVTTTLTSDNIIVNKNLYVIGNISNTNIANLNINGSLYPAIDNFFDIGNNTLRWRNANFTGTIQSNILTSPTITATNLYDLDSSNFFDLTGCGTGATFTAIDQTGAITCSAISITESQISDLKAYQVEANAFDRGNLTDFFGSDTDINNTVLRSTNTSYFNPFFNKGNLSLAPFSNFTKENLTLAPFSNYTKENFTSQYDGRTDRWGISNLTQYLGGSDVNASIIKAGNLSTVLSNQNTSLWNRTGTSTILKNINDNVGIGTTTPDNRLTISGTDADANLATIGLLHLNITDSYNKSTTNFITLDHNLNNPENSTGGIGLGVLFRATNNDSELVNVSFINASLVNAINGSEQSSLAFYTLNGSGGQQGRLLPRLILNGSDVQIAPTLGNVIIAPNGGNVGIGTAVPSYEFDIQGGRFYVDVAGSVTTMTSYGSNSGRIAVTDASDSSSRLFLFDGGGGSRSEIGTTRSTLYVGAGVTEDSAPSNLVILSSGKVGISTTTPSSTLEVKGNFTVSDKTNASIGNFTIGQFNASCSGFRFGASGGWILSCTP